MKTKVEFFHRYGSKVEIIDIPQVDNEYEKFNLKRDVEKLIDKIDELQIPSPVYSLISEMNKKEWTQ